MNHFEQMPERSEWSKSSYRPRRCVMPEHQIARFGSRELAAGSLIAKLVARARPSCQGPDAMVLATKASTP